MRTSALCLELANYLQFWLHRQLHHLCDIGLVLLLHCSAPSIQRDLAAAQARHQREHLAAALALPSQRCWVRLQRRRVCSKVLCRKGAVLHPAPAAVVLIPLRCTAAVGREGVTC